MLPIEFQKAIEKLKKLAEYDEYRGAFVFGSAARDEVTEDSDLDVKVLVAGENACEQINHPFIGSIKLDLTFQTEKTMADQIDANVKSNRVPMIAESLILFDKDGTVTRLKKESLAARARKFTPEEYQLQQFLIYHLNDKVERNLLKEPSASLLSMNIGLNDLFKIHYGLAGRWWVSSKRLLRDLKTWDVAAAELLERLLVAPDVKSKFPIWSKLIDHITTPMGGRMPIEDNICACPICSAHLASLAEIGR